MTCARARQVLDALVDLELDEATEREIEAHLASCQDCERQRGERVLLRDRIRRDAPRFAAPTPLRSAIAHAVAGADAFRPPLANRPTWKFAAWFAATAAGAGVAAGIWLGRPALTDAHRELAVASHVASLSPQRRLIDIASTDRHAVKPWFAGKIDFSPPVRDLAAEGFALAGARLDHVGERQAAAVVYRVRNHDINLFVWRAASEGQREPAASAFVRGFAITTWAQDGLRFAAVSDVDLRDLERFAGLVRELR